MVKLAALLAWSLAAQRFVILGDRTGEAQPGVYEQVWRELANGKPEFVVAAGDTIQGLSDPRAETQWLEVMRALAPYRAIPLYLVPGNHDVWSALSEKLFVRFAKRPLHYSFDAGDVHFTVLNNSRSDEMPADQLAFLEADLQKHAGRPVKFVISHRPSWLFQALLENPNFRLHGLARKYGVRYVVAGHVHQMLRFELDGVTYWSVPSAGGHLRASKQYADGWFFGHTRVRVSEGGAHFEVREIGAPHGKGRVTELSDWGKLGLLRR